MRADCLSGTGMRSPSSSDLGRELELDVLLRHGALADGHAAEAAQRADDVVDERLRRRRAGGEADALRAGEELGRDLAGVLDQQRPAAGALRNLHEPARV